MLRVELAVLLIPEGVKLEMRLGQWDGSSLGGSTTSMPAIPTQLWLNESQLGHLRARKPSVSAPYARRQHWTCTTAHAQALHLPNYSGLDECNKKDQTLFLDQKKPNSNFY